MPVQFSRGQNGNILWAQEYTGPYAGLDSQSPPLLVADNASPSFLNFMLRNKELRSRPQFVPASVPQNIAAALGTTNFVDINGTYHVVAWLGRLLYQYSVPNWVSLGNAAPANINNPVRYRAFANQIFYTAVSQPITPPQPGGGGAPGLTQPFVGYWDGLTANPVYQQTQYDASVTNSIAGIATASAPTVGGSLPGGPTLTGPLSIGANYLAELNNQLILANINVLDQGTATLYNFPNLMWWSANGLPLQWDPTQNTSAGFNAFLDVSDVITGLMTFGVAGYIFRSYGITQFATSGNAVAPFTFDHMWASEHGIGNVLSWSVAQYGPQGAFVAQDNIYSLSLTQSTPIGGTARDAIMNDLANMLVGPAFSPAIPFAAILPIYKAGYVYLTYNLLIPFQNANPFEQGELAWWVYSFEDKNWMRWQIPFGAIAGTFLSSILCAPNVV